MKPSFRSTNITPKRSDSTLNDEQFWGRFETMAARLAKLYPDLEFVRTRDTWELRSQNRAAMEAFEELSLIFCNRVKGTYLTRGYADLQWVMAVKTVSDAVQAFIWTIFGNHKIGNQAAVNTISSLKKDYAGALTGRISQI